jgi:hypothetical protein
LANQPVDHTAAYFALAGALGAAFLVILGNLLGAWRQRRAEADRLNQQLRAERERLDIQLAAERERLDVQLAYDRRLRDLDELRRQVSAVFVKSTQLIAPVIEMHKLRWKTKARTSTENELLVSREREVLDTLNDLRLDNMALSLLTGLHEDLVKHHAAFLDAAQRVRFAANLEDGEQGLREQSSALSDFAVVANRLVRAKFE